MIALHARGNHFLAWDTQGEAFVCRLTTNPYLPPVLAKQSLLLLDTPASVSQETVACYRGVCIRSAEPRGVPGVPTICLDPALYYLADGDVVRVRPQRSEIHVLYRRRSRHNTLLVTERCNSFCLMCSQPPRDIDDSYLVAEVKRTIELISRNTDTLGITGGEPTLLGGGFFEIVQHARNFLPDTALHVLTNGRLFADRALAQRLATVRHPGLTLGIPLYSDQPDLHDFVVQAHGAHAETIKGLLNLKSEGIAIELRIVIHRQTYERLPDLARFIARNLAFVDYVALMGLELTGFTKANLPALWIDPHDYREHLAEAVSTLQRFGVHAVIYNHQLCVVPENVRSVCARSISDWKNQYLDVCEQCAMRRACGGFFSSGLGLLKRSAHIAPFAEPIEI